MAIQKEQILGVPGQIASSEGLLTIAHTLANNQRYGTIIPHNKEGNASFGVIVQDGFQSDATALALRGRIYVLAQKNAQAGAYIYINKTNQQITYEKTAPANLAQLHATGWRVVQGGAQGSVIEIVK